MLPDTNVQITDPALDAELDALDRKWAAQAVEDEKARRDPVLRVGMTKLVTHFGDLLADIADAAALETGSDSAFDADEMRGLMIWQFAEFLTGAIIERGDDECYLSLRRWYEMDERHAATFFDTTRVGSEWEIVAVEKPPVAGQQVASAPAPKAESLDDVIARVVASAAPGATVDQLIADVLREKPAPVGYEGSSTDVIRQRLEAARTQQQQDERDQLRELVANGLRELNWIENEMFVNPHNGTAAAFDADLAELLQLVTDKSDLDETTPITLQQTITRLIGLPAAEIERRQAELDAAEPDADDSE